MDKNQNGLPEMGENGGCNPPPRPGFDDNSHMNGNCGGGGCLSDRPLAYVYAPDQHFRMLYSAPEALSHGTLFEELYKPMEVYGRE